jgi:hypothetical protein
MMVAAQAGDEDHCFPTALLHIEQLEVIHPHVRHPLLLSEEGQCHGG